MKITVSIGETVARRARSVAEAMGKSLDQVVRDYLETLACNDIERDVAEFRRLAGGGHSKGCRFNREELHERT